MLKTEYHKRAIMERAYQISSQVSEKVELKMAYFCRLPLLLIVENVLMFINDKLDIFRG
jgi:hypothetical protein